MGKCKLYKTVLLILCLIAVLIFMLKWNAKLYRAIEYRNFEAVKEAVNEGYNINSIGLRMVSVWDISFVNSPLVVAIFNNEYEIAEYLVRCGADVNYISPSGKSILLYLTENDICGDIYDLIIEYGANVNYVNEDGTSLLEEALTRNMQEAVYALLNNENIIVSDRIVENLIAELQNNRDNYVGYGFLKELLKHNNVNSQIYDSIFDSLKIINMDINSDYSELITYCTAAFGKTDTLKWLLNNNSDYDKSELYLLACEYGNIDNVKYLLSMGVDINTSDKVGITAIERAMRKNQCDIVKYLLQRGASTRGEKGTNYDDILSYSVKNNNYDITKQLIEKYNDNLDIEQALYDSVVEGSDLALKAFLDTGTSPNFKFEMNESCLLEIACYFASDEQGINCVKLLLDYGANVNGFNGQPLINAVKNGNTETVSLLVSHNVDLNYNLNNGDETVTALRYAATGGYYDIVKILVENNAKFSVPNDYKNEQEFKNLVYRIKLSKNIYNYLLENGLI